MDSNIVAALIGAGATVAAAVYTTRQMMRAAQPNEEISSRTTNESSSDLDEILERLEHYRQRATFGAVAGFLGCQPYTLFDGYPRNRRTSWVVNKDSGEPTGFNKSAMHPDLHKNPHIITNSNELKRWLSTHP